MKALAQIAWDTIPNKRQVLMTALVASVVMAVIGGSVSWFAFNVPVWKGLAAAPAVLQHMHRYPKHDHETIQAHTEMFAMLPEYVSGAARVIKLADDLADHVRGKLRYMDRDGNFLSDFYRAEYEEGERDLIRKIENQRLKSNDQNSFYSSQVQFAQRER